MKNYINDFCEDLNYKGIVLYIGYLEPYELEKLRTRLFSEPSYLNKQYRWEYINNGSKFFYVENCDLQDCNGYELAQCILFNDCKFYELQYDSQSDKFYYEIEVGQ